MTQSLEIAHGMTWRSTVSVGDRFKWWDGTEWEIVRFTKGGMYSPSGLGGTPILECKQIGGETKLYDRYRKDGVVEWCGDSVAGALSGRIR